MAVGGEVRRGEWQGPTGLVANCCGTRFVKQSIIELSFISHVAPCVYLMDVELHVLQNIM